VIQLLNLIFLTFFIRCIATIKEWRNISVLYTMVSESNNLNDLTCGNVSIEEHKSCECACQFTDEDCYVGGDEVI